MTELTRWVVEDKEKKGVFWPSEAMRKKANMSDCEIYSKAAEDPVAFWEKQAAESIHWDKKWGKAYEAKPPFFRWFIRGKLNACYNCVDRHVKAGKGDKVAIYWEPEGQQEQPRIITYAELCRQVQRFANVLKGFGVKKGDRVGIYLPMVPEVYVAMLACARIGAIHSVVFSAFSGESLRTRLIDSGAKVLVTADSYYRRGKPIDLKKNADIGAEATKVQKVVIVKRAVGEMSMKNGRDFWWHELMEKAKPECRPVSMESEDILYILYTSGTTGKPKGIIHETGGYLTQAFVTSKWVFDLQDDDVFWCTADVGWVTGHTYGCYGPFSVGATCVMYEGSPDYPDWGRFWAIAEKYRVSVFYTAPTAIRMFAKMGEEWPAGHDLSSIRLLATVGEPIDNEAWMWYFEHIGGKRCPITDTWWQTETGGTLINALPGIGPFIPTVAGKSFPGTRHEIFDSSGKAVKEGESGFLVQLPPFAPGMLRGVYRDPKKYRQAYFSEYGKEVYFTSDGARWFDSCNIRVTGRVDDIMKVAGHRLSTAELEDVVSSLPEVAESAVVPAPDEIKGQIPVVFAIMRKGMQPAEAEKIIVESIVKAIGPTAKPGRIIFVDDLPKTRSGKIMRRILRNLLVGEEAGDITTLNNPESVEHIRQVVGCKARA